MPPRKHQQLMTAAVQHDAEGQRALMEGDRDAARSAFATASDLYRQSWVEAPASAYGRLVGMLKSSVLAGGGVPEARYVRAELGDRDPASATASYAQALAALILGPDSDDSDAEAALWAERMAAGNEAFVRTAKAMSALAAHDADGYAAALAVIVRDFEQRTDHLTGVAIADTALVLSVLGARRGMAAAIESRVLPGL